jgi:hypothetical protein
MNRLDFLHLLKTAAETAKTDPGLAEEYIAEALGLKAEIQVIDDFGAYLDKRATRKCIHPECDVLVDIRKHHSGACCKTHMNYECSHPDCLKKAAAKGWKRYTHPFGTRIAVEHWDYRKRENLERQT